MALTHGSGSADGSTADVERSAIRFRFDAGDKVHAYDPDDVQRGPVPAVVRSVKTSRSRGHTYSVKFKGDSQSRRLQPWMVVASLPRRTLDDLRSQKWATGRFNKRELLEWLDAKGVATDDGSRIKRLLDAATDFSSRDRGSRLQYLTPLLATLGVHNPNASAEYVPLSRHYRAGGCTALLTWWRCAWVPTATTTKVTTASLPSMTMATAKVWKAHVPRSAAATSAWVAKGRAQRH